MRYERSLIGETPRRYHGRSRAGLKREAGRREGGLEDLTWS